MQKNNMSSRRNIYIMYFISLLQGLVFYAPVATLYRQAQGVTVFQITLIESISLVLCMVMELPWGMLADKIGYKRTMIVCNVLYFVSKIVFWKANGFGGFLLERILLSIVCAGLSGVDSSILYLSCDRGESQKVFGFYEGMGTIGLLATSFVYSMFIKNDYLMSGFLTVISYGAAMILSFLLVEVKMEGEKKKKNSLKEFAVIMKEIMHHKGLILFLMGIALFNETHQTFTVFLSQLQYVRAGISHSMMGILYGFITIVSLGGFLSDKVTRWIGEYRTMGVCFTAAVISCLILCCTSNAVLSVVAVMLLRMGYSIARPLQLELQNRQVAVKNRATVLSVYSVFMSSVGVGTNVVFGWLAEFSLIMVFGVGALVCAAAWLMYELWYSKCKIH